MVRISGNLCIKGLSFGKVIRLKPYQTYQSSLPSLRIERAHSLAEVTPAIQNSTIPDNQTSVFEEEGGEDYSRDKRVLSIEMYDTILRVYI